MWVLFFHGFAAIWTMWVLKFFACGARDCIIDFKNVSQKLSKFVEIFKNPPSKPRKFFCALRAHVPNFSPQRILSNLGFIFSRFCGILTNVGFKIFRLRRNLLDLGFINSRKFQIRVGGGLKAIAWQSRIFHCR